MSLFPEDREIPADALDSVQVKLSGLELRRPRVFGNCRLAGERWQRLPEAREAVSGEKVTRLLVVVHRPWFLNSAMDERLETGFAVAGQRIGCTAVRIGC